MPSAMLPGNRAPRAAGGMRLPAQRSASSANTQRNLSPFIKSSREIGGLYHRSGSYRTASSSERMPHAPLFTLIANEYGSIPSLSLGVLTDRLSDGWFVLLCRFCARDRVTLRSRFSGRFLNQPLYFRPEACRWL